MTRSTENNGTSLGFSEMIAERSKLMAKIVAQEDEITDMLDFLALVPGADAWSLSQAKANFIQAFMWAVRATAARAPKE